MAAPLASDVAEKIDRLIAAGMRRTVDIKAELARQGFRRIPGHNAIVRRRVLWDAANAAPDAENRPGQSPQAAPEAPPSLEPEGVKSFEESGDTAKIQCVIHKGGGVVGEEDLIRVCKLDLTRWRIKRLFVNTYQTGMKLETKEEAPSGVRRVIHQEPHVVQLYSVKAELERIAPKDRLDSLPLVFAPFRDLAPRFDEFASPPAGSSVVLVVGLMDVHFGKLAWAAECGEDYDLEIAETVFANAIEDLMAATAHLKVELILLPIGNDLVHIDTPQNTTTAGTPVDTDGRQPKIIAVVKRALIRGVKRLAERAPVDGFGVPGNHDMLSVLWFMHMLDAYFHNTDRVRIDLQPTVRKYRQYGQTLFGFTHGDEVRDSQIRSLMNLMTVEQRDKISSTTYSEWFCGHQHRSRKFEQKSTDTYQGTVVRFLSALSGTDAWHAKHGLVGSRQAAEVYAYHKDHGYLGHFLAPARR